MVFENMEVKLNWKLKIKLKKRNVSWFSIWSDSIEYIVFVWNKSNEWKIGNWFGKFEKKKEKR